MNEKLDSSYLTERKESLQAIKEYILSLLKKPKEKENQTKKELEDTLKSKDEKELQKQKEESFLDKMKKKLFDQEENKKQEKNKDPYIYQDSQLKFPPEDQDEYLPQDMEIGNESGEQSHF
ncbi:MAG: hypothetical protein LBO09_04035 [Candidatus Peribacteria bacterium]|jgi:hypothetical protein|nr:hypothetical protein [Candidatus Peribacteria bacterium]